MGAFSDVIHALLIPAGIAIVLYLSLSFLILPAIRRYRNRYDQYIPLQRVSNTVAASTSTLRDRLADVVTRIALPHVRGRMLGRTIVQQGRDDSLEDLYALEEGEELEDFIERAEHSVDESSDA
ncbi:hypothetical protein BDZ85DRAFT_269779 [Elsinoe ampelina]|uniref:Uncharacterized protein n=1 Tax=Elsinoe ampelina TaxID=302913 RepID=A0A6A6FZ45_9PEZI|nr:hypothetical protein BDZ85DRAFT_269779 [Elsinoe ampelina]